MTENNIKEQLSECFIKLIASNSGFKITEISPDDGGIDVDMTYSTPVDLNGEINYIESGEYIHLQLKATTEKQIKRDRNNLKYNLRVSNYNKLVFIRKQNRNVPAFLVLFILPDDKNAWLEVLSNHLKLKKHAYWYIPSIADNTVVRDKNSTITISIPNENKFTLNTITDLFKNYIPK